MSSDDEGRWSRATGKKFRDVLTGVNAHPGLSGSDMKVAFSLLRQMRDLREPFYRSVADIMLDTRLSEWTVKRSISRLRDADMIRPAGRNRSGVTLYSIGLGYQWTKDQRDADQSELRRTKQFLEAIARSVEGDPLAETGAVTREMKRRIEATNSRLKKAAKPDGPGGRKSTPQRGRKSTPNECREESIKDGFEGTNPLSAFQRTVPLKTGTKP